MLRLAIAIAAALASGCGQGDSSPTPTTGEPPSEAAAGPEQPPGEPPASTAAPDVATDPAILSGLQALGDDYAVVGVFVPDAWAKFHARIRTVVAASAEATEAWGELGSPDRVVLGVVRSVLAMHGVDTSVALDGLDPKQPIVAGMMRSQLPDHRTGGLTSLAMESVGDYPLLHEVRLPANDAKALAASLDRALSDVGDPKPELVAGMAGTTARAGRRTWVVVTAEPNAVRLVAANALHAPTPTLVRDALSMPSPSTEITPALLAASAPGQVGAAVVRPWHLRKVGVWLGAVESVLAVSTVSAGQRSSAMMAARGLVLGSEAVMGDTPTEFDDWSYALASNDEQIAIRTVGSATPHGRRLLAAAATPRPGFALRVDAPVAEARLAVDVGVLVEQAVEPGFVRATTTADEALEMARQCGQTCGLHLLMRAPLGLTTLARRLARTEGLPLPAPTVLHAVVTEVGPKEIKGALAMELSGDGELPSVRALAKLAPDALTLSEGTRDGKPVLLLGWNVDPNTVFDLSASGPDSVALMVATANAGTISKAMAGQLGALDSIVGSAGAGAWLTRRDNAVVYDVVLAPTAAPTPPAVPGFSQARWTSPKRLATDEAAETCLARYAAGGSRLLMNARKTNGDERTKRLTGGLTALEATYRCASADPDTVPALEAIRRSVVDIAITSAMSRFDVAELSSLLSAECKRGKEDDEDRCADAKAVAGLTRATVPTIEATCDGAGSGPRSAVPIQMHEADVVIGLRRAEPSDEALDEALVANAWSRVGGQPRFGAFSIFAPPETTTEQLTPVLRALAKRDVEALGLAIENESTMSAIGARLMDAKTIATRSYADRDVVVTIGAGGTSIDGGPATATLDTDALQRALASTKANDATRLVIALQPGGAWSEVVAAAATGCTDDAPVIKLP